ncbi:MAG: TPM domain-containing protein, partial [Microbacterium sp.]
MRARWTAALTATVSVAFATIGGAAWASDPVELGAGYVVDEAGVLSSGESAAAQARLEQLKSETGLDLYVAYVDDFSNPDDNADWANTTADNNDLGVSQYLLAVAVDGRSYYLSADSEGPVTPDQIAAIEQQRIQPALSADDWLGAVDAAADGLTDASNGGSGAPGDAGGGGGLLTWILVIAAIGAAVAVIVVIVRRRRKSGAADAPAVGQVPLEELER